MCLVFSEVLQVRRIVFVEGLHNAIFIASAVGILFSTISLITHIFSEFDFTVLKIETICEKPLNNRCVDHYSVINKNGASVDLTLSAYKLRPNEVVVGNSLKKDRFSLEYWVNGKKVQWEYFFLHIMVITMSVLCFIWWQYLSRKITES